MMQAILSLGGLGLLFGGLLAFAAKKLAVETNPRVDAVQVCLPGANCGACGYAGCFQFAKAVVEGEASLTACIPGGCDVSDQVAEILGRAKAEAGEKLVSSVICLGDCHKTRTKFDYDGVQDCKAVVLYDGGAKACSYACIGLGTCVRACPFEAISMDAHGLPLVDLDKCTGCRMCEKSCPKKVIVMKRIKAAPQVKCHSTAKGKEVRAACDIGCIGCGICVKNCPEEAISMEDNLAFIDISKCTNCGICVEKCPRNCII